MAHVRSDPIWRIRQAGIALALTMAAGMANAAEYPERPVRMIVPFIAGGPVDAVARLVAQDLSLRLGQAFVVENLSGAGGSVGTETAARAAPDGYTLLLALNSQTFGLYSHELDLQKSFAPVATIAKWSHVLVVRPDLPIRTLGELIAYAKEHPGALTLGYGTNTPPQLLGETLKKAAEIDLSSIPYRGGGQAVVDMLGGRIDINFGSTATLLPLIRDGKLRPIAYTGEQRADDLPDVPTVTEAGLGQLAFRPDAWAMLLAPKGTPPVILDGLNAAVNSGLKTPEMPAHLARLGYTAQIGTREETARFLADEIVKWPPIVRAAGLKRE